MGATNEHEKRLWKILAYSTELILLRPLLGFSLYLHLIKDLL